MQTEISFRGFKPMEAQTQAIEKQIAHFAKGFPFINSLSLIVASPGHHHRNGEVFEIGLRARLPTGKEIDISNRPKDERYADFYFALNDVFKRARRHLNGKSEKLRGDVKTHASAASKAISE
jgi:hypothetical protein